MKWEYYRHTYFVVPHDIVGFNLVIDAPCMSVFAPVIRASVTSIILLLPPYFAFKNVHLSGYIYIVSF